jgi:isoamylase
MNKLYALVIVLLVLFSCSNQSLLQDQAEEQVIDHDFKVYSSAVGGNHPVSGVFAPVSESTWGTSTWKQGAHFDAGPGTDLTIAVYAKNASKVLLEIYSSAIGSNASYDYWMAKGSDGVWRAKLNDVPNHALYAFRAWGPNWPYSSSWNRGNSSAGFITDVDANGNRYNPNKVLYDPYTREMSHDKEIPAMAAAGDNGGMYGTGGLSDPVPNGYTGTLSGGVAIDRRKVDTGKWAPKSVAVHDTTAFGTKPNIAQKDAMIYEAHVRGITQDQSAVSLGTILNGLPGFENVVNIPNQYRGTYKGAGYFAKYLKSLGFTTIELLPVHETANDINPDDNPGGNYWGYMTYGYFAPDRRYSYDKSYGGPTKEFKEMCKAFHDEGLEVYIDVVYNHTGEGGTWDAAARSKELTSFAGLDNSEWYMLVDTDKSKYWETTGCGNNMNATKTVVKEFVKDSLTYWMDEMGVDGFRFDLAPVLGRDVAPSFHFNKYATLLSEISSLGQSRNCEMIAEAWDTQWSGGYQVSNFPYGWGEWNGIYRDVVRKFVIGEGHKTTNYPSLSTVFNGSYDLEDRNPGSGNDHTGFHDNGGPHMSVNFLDAHDGFTLMDLVSYNSKMNETLEWPWGPSDGGSSNNDSWDSAGDQGLRRQQLRNLWTILFMSRGIPMTVWGDEFARTQNGNNNPYNIDSICTWNNYNMINTDSPNTVIAGQHNNFGTDNNADGYNTLFKFVKTLTGLRASHDTFRQDDYNMSIQYRKENGTSWLSDSDKCVWIRMDGSAVGDSDFIIMINSYHQTVNFTLPTAATGKEWYRIIDTAEWAEGFDNSWSLEEAWKTRGGSYGVFGRSIAVFQETSGPVSTTTSTTTTTTGGSGVRTVIFMKKQTVSGQDIFVKGGHDAGLVPGLYPSMSEPITYLNTLNTTTAAIKAADASLDWGSESALDWTTNLWPASWGTKRTYAADGYGEDPENKWGSHWWKFDVLMDGSAGEWYEFKAFMREGSTEWWESDRAQTGTPYNTINHWGKKGFITRCEYNQNWVEFTQL